MMSKKSVVSIDCLKLQFIFVQGFNDKNLVVCVRQLKPLTKFEKMWNSPCIAIEDPFDLDHNLGAGLSRKSKKELSGIEVNHPQFTNCKCTNRGREILVEAVFSSRLGASSFLAGSELHKDCPLYLPLITVT